MMNIHSQRAARCCRTKLCWMKNTPHGGAEVKANKLWEGSHQKQDKAGPNWLSKISGGRLSSAGSRIVSLVTAGFE